MTVTDSGVAYSYITRGNTYLLNGFDTDHGLTIRYLGDQGFGLAPLHRITTRGPLQHGDSDIDFRLDPRIVQLPLIVENTSRVAPIYTHYDIRRILLDIFRPQETGILQVGINYTISSVLYTALYKMNVRVLGGLEFNVDPKEYHIRTVVQLRADDPTWYNDTDPLGVVFTTTYVNANINGSQVFAIGGNWFSFPIIRLIGPITNPVITNTTTGRSISVTGTIAAGTSYYYDLRYGFKTVYTGPNQTGTNVIANVSATSDLATWSFVPGNNTLSITGTGTTGATNAVFTHPYRFTGI